MPAYHQNTYQLIFTPKHRHPVLEKAGRPRLFAYATGFFKNKKCVLFAVNGVEDHLHFVFYKHPSIAESDLIRDLKKALHSFIDKTGIFPMFTNWQVRYSCFSYSYKDRNRVIAYVEKQEVHHAHQLNDYLTELRQLYAENGLQLNEDQYLE
ncbi:MAG: transposase [Saprospiraceae bacterium]